MPIQPWHSLLPRKLRAETVSANAKNAVSAPRCPRQALEIQLLLVVEHRLQTLATHVARARAVDGVAHLHVVGGDALGDRAGSTADAEEPAHHFLPRADLGEGAVEAGIEVDLQGLVAGGCRMRTRVSHGCTGLGLAGALRFAWRPALGLLAQASGSVRGGATRASKAAAPRRAHVTSSSASSRMSTGTV